MARRCSGLAAVNKEPDEWECCNDGDDLGTTFMNIHTGKLVECSCPWQVGIDYNGVTVTAITAKRVQDMTAKEAMAEGMEHLCPGYRFPNWSTVRETPQEAFGDGWDSIHRRDRNNRYARNPWTWRLSIEQTKEGK